MKFLLALFLAGAPLAAPLASFADDGTPATRKILENFCAQGLGEGSYQLHLGAAGSATVHLICTARGDLLATGFVGPDGEPFSLTHWAVDGDILSFVSFETDPEEASEVGGIGGSAIRLRLNIDALKDGVMSGTFQSPLMTFPARVDTKRRETFPRCGGGNLEAKVEGEGYFVVKKAPARGALGAGAVVGVEIIGGVQRIFVVNGENFGAALYNGLRRENAGDAICSSLGIDDDEHGYGPMLSVRGKFTSPDEITFYYFSTRHGMQGPFVAERH